MYFRLENIRKAVDGLKDDLGEGFVQTDIWNTKELKSVVHDHSRGLLPIYGMIPKHIKIFSEISRMLIKAIEELDDHSPGDYYLVNLKENKVVIVIFYSSRPAKRAEQKAELSSVAPKKAIEFQQFILVDMDKTTLGALMGIAIPNMLENLK